MATLLNRTYDWDFKLGIVAPDTLQVNSQPLYDDFKSHLLSMYQPHYTDLEARIMHFQNNDQLSDYCGADDYTTEGRRPLMFVVSFNAVGDQWDYWIRMNVSNIEEKYKQVPDTW